MAVITLPLAEFNVTVGMLYRGEIRNFLEKSRDFDGMAINWFEEKNLMVSDFTVRGNPDDIRIIAQSIDAWQRELEAAATTREEQERLRKENVWFRRWTRAAKKALRIQ